MPQAQLAAAIASTITRNNLYIAERITTAFRMSSMFTLIAMFTSALLLHSITILNFPIYLQLALLIITVVSCVGLGMYLLTLEALFEAKRNPSVRLPTCI